MSKESKRKVQVRPQFGREFFGQASYIRHERLFKTDTTAGKFYGANSDILRKQTTPISINCRTAARVRKAEQTQICSPRAAEEAYSFRLHYSDLKVIMGSTAMARRAGR